MSAPTSALLVLLATMLTACGGGSGNGSASSSDQLSGNWQMTLQQDPNTSNTESGFILQSGSAISGKFVIAGETACAGVGSVQGKVTGPDVALTVDQIGQRVGLTGTTKTSDSITGTYSILAAGCGSSEVGAWTADRVKPLNGNFQGQFTSGPTPGLVYDITGTVKQAANTGATTSDLSGTITSTNAPCFTSLLLAGSISGTSVVYNFVTSDGASVGQFHGTTTTDGVTLTGVYQFNVLTNQCTGDSGTGILTIQ